MLCPATGKFCSCEDTGTCDVPYDRDDMQAECIDCNQLKPLDYLDKSGRCPSCAHLRKLDHADGEIPVERRLNKRRYE